MLRGDKIERRVSCCMGADKDDECQDNERQQSLNHVLQQETRHRPATTEVVASAGTARACTGSSLTPSPTNRRSNRARSITQTSCVDAPPRHVREIYPCQGT